MCLPNCRHVVLMQRVFSSTCISNSCRALKKGYFVKACTNVDVKTVVGGLFAVSLLRDAAIGILSSSLLLQAFLSFSIYASFLGFAVSYHLRLEEIYLISCIQYSAFLIYWYFVLVIGRTVIASIVTVTNYIYVVIPCLYKNAKET